MRHALITGITGQDGSYLAEQLLTLGYEVHGTVRRSSAYHWDRINHIKDQLHLHYADLGDSGSIQRVLDLSQPHEVYNLAAQSHVKVSFDMPEYTADITGTGTIRLLEELRNSNARFYQASSSEMFGSSPPPQNEKTPFHPRSPYGCSKVFSYYATVNYREAYGLHASNGILFNHESPRRGENFVTRKITRAVAAIKFGLQQSVRLGNLDARRDWGHAKDYVNAMYLMLQQAEPDDYVIATGVSWSVRDFCELAFHALGLNWRDHVIVDPKFFRPSEVEHLLGDPAKAMDKLGWEPEIQLSELVEEMVKHDYDAIKKTL
jgi:GDPmannose 4,6-dehydratase